MKTFRDAMRSKDFVVTAELPLSAGTTAEEVRHAVRTLRSCVTALQISDNTSAEPHMSPIAAAALVLQEQADAVVRLSCRDRNRIALQSDLMGAAALGVTSMVLSRGEKLPASLKQRVKGVFDIGRQRLLATAMAISANHRLVAPPGFYLGANVNIIDPPADWTAGGVDSKADAGCKFLQTQPCLDTEILRRYTNGLIAAKLIERVSVMVQVPLLDSMDMLRELRSTRRPLQVPESIVNHLDTASNFAADSESLCVDTLRDLAGIPGVSGANILHQGDPRAVVRMLTRWRGNEAQS